MGFQVQLNFMRSHREIEVEIHVVGRSVPTDADTGHQTVTAKKAG